MTEGTPNSVTIRAAEDAEAGRVKSFNSVDEMFTWLEGEWRRRRPRLGEGGEVMDLREKVVSITVQWAKKGAPVGESEEMADRIISLFDEERRELMHSEKTMTDAALTAIRRAEAAEARVKQLEEERGEAVLERDRLRHYVECANTPLMRDVLAERDAYRDRVKELRDTLRGEIRFLEMTGEQVNPRSIASRLRTALGKDVEKPTTTSATTSEKCKKMLRDAANLDDFDAMLREKEE